MAWIYLIIGGLFEVGFTTCLNKVSESSGAVSASWFGAFLVCCSLSVYLLYKASLTLPMGTAYAVWAGIGAVGTALVGIIFFNNPADFWRMFFICTLIGSIVGLKAVAH